MWEQQEYEFLAALGKIRRAFVRSQVISDVPHPVVMVMRAIERTCAKDDSVLGMKMSDISQLLGITKPASTHIVNDLERKGFVERIMTKNDRRVVYVRITEAGKKALAQGEKEFLGLIKSIAELLGEQDMNELIRIVKKLSDALGEYTTGEQVCFNPFNKFLKNRKSESNR